MHDFTECTFDLEYRFSTLKADKDYRAKFWKILDSFPKEIHDAVLNHVLAHREQQAEEACQ